MTIKSLKFNNTELEFLIEKLTTSYTRMEENLPYCDQLDFKSCLKEINLQKKLVKKFKSIYNKDLNIEDC